MRINKSFQFQRRNFIGQMELERKLYHSVLLVGTETKESKSLCTVKNEESTQNGEYFITHHQYSFYQFANSDSFEKGFPKIAEENKAIKDKKYYIKNGLKEDKATLIITRGCAVNFFEFDINDAPDEDSIKKLIEQQNKIKEEYYLIIGRDDGIEEELYSDIVRAFKVAGVEFKNFNHKFGQFLSKDESSESRKINVLYIPTIQEFEEQILFCVQSQIGKEVNLFYCGHGTPSGEIVLKDGNYSGKQFNIFLDKLNLTYYPNITIYLNCCYALQFVDQIVDNCFKTFFETFYSIVSTEGSRSIDDEKLEQILKLPEDEYEKNIMKMYEREKRYLSKNFGQYKFNFVPLSSKEMKASGYLFPLSEIDNIKSFRHFTEFVKYEKIDEETLTKKFINYLPNDQDYKEPTVHIFQAKDGDSSLFCFEDKCILIDGGRSKLSEPELPCFWNKLKEFKKVNCVILTHGDADHWEGLLPFLYAQEEIPDKVPKISKFVMTWSDEQSDEKFAENILKKQKRNYYHVYHIGDYVNKILKKTIFQNYVEPGIPHKFENIELTYILPRKGYSEIYMDLVHLSNRKNIYDKLNLSNELSESFREYAQKKYQKLFGENLNYQAYGNLTNINIFGISFVIKCQGKLFLFTADCHSKDIVDGLEEHFENQKKFWYVDAPHHGSQDNHFKLLLDYCEKIENLVVSSNHKSRPSKIFLSVLKGDQESDTPKIKKIYFNYETKQSKKFVDELEKNKSNIVQNTSKVFEINLILNDMD